jgi:hypothetical protein
VADKADRPIELGEDVGDDVGIALGSDRLGWRRADAETGEIEGQGRETGEAGLEVGTATTPPMKSEDPRRPFAEDLGEEGTVRERPQSQDQSSITPGDEPTITGEELIR